MRYVKDKSKVISFLAIFIILVPGLFYYSLYKAVKYIENRDQQIFQDGFEIGHFQGLTEGTENAYDDFYARLSPNPQVSYLFKKYFPKEEEARIMRAISLAESQGQQKPKPNRNTNGSIDFGFFQINTVHKKKGETIAQFHQRMSDLEANFKEARRILDTQGLTAWSTYNDGKYLTYLK